MSLASASPRRASLDSDVIHIATSPLPSSPRPQTARSRHRHQALQPPATTAGALPPARSSSPRHHAHVSSAALNNTTNNNASPPRHISNYFSPSPSPSRRLRHSLSSQHRPLRSAASSVTGNNRLRAQPAAAASSYDQHLIDEFLRNEFYSTTSPFASFTNPPPPSDDDIYRGNSYTDLHSRITTTTTITTQNSDCMGRANDAAADVPDSPSQQLQAGPSANTTQNTDFSLNDESQYSPLFPDLPDDQGVTETAATSFSETMPAATTTLRRGHSDIVRTPKRQRGNLPAERLVPPQERPKPLGPDEDLFGDVPPAPTAVAEDDDFDEENLTTIDLTEATGVLPELREPIVDNRIKIAAFQCAICMDDVAGLTVTYCGHLFCAVCLHQSLTNVESLKGRCPMCRSKIDTKLRGSYTNKTKGFWPLELKLMTKTRRGKRKAEDITK